MVDHEALGLAGGFMQVPPFRIVDLHLRRILPRGVIGGKARGDLVDVIQKAYFDHTDGIVINPAAYTHTSVAILDALKAVSIPTVEVHLSDIYSRDKFRQFSYTSMAAEKTIAGEGFDGYRHAMEYLIEQYG